MILKLAFLSVNADKAAETGQSNDDAEAEDGDELLAIPMWRISLM